jgi:hypothetical protein
MMSPLSLVFGILWLGFAVACTDALGFLGILLGVGGPACVMAWLYRRMGGDSFSE